MLNEDQVHWGVRVRVLSDLPNARVKAGTVGEIVEARRDPRPDYWGFWIAWWVSPSRTKTSLRLTRDDLPHLELASQDVEPQAPELSGDTASSPDGFPWP